MAEGSQQVTGYWRKEGSPNITPSIVE
jgi:hypothetical protein